MLGNDGGDLPAAARVVVGEIHAQESVRRSCPRALALSTRRDSRQSSRRKSLRHLRPPTMALPLPPGLTPSEIAFLCEMELVTVIPRQRLESLDLLGVSS